MEKTKIFYDKTKFKQHLSTNPALQKILLKILQKEIWLYPQKHRQQVISQQQFPKKRNTQILTQKNNRN